MTRPADDHTTSPELLPRKGRGTPIPVTTPYWTLSDEAIAEIRAVERRQRRVIATSHLFTFGGSNDC